MKAQKIRKTPGASYEEREQYWTRVIERARSYPGGITEFCKVFKIRQNNYYQWFKRLKLKHPEWEERLPTNKNKKPKEPGFVPVIVKVNPEVLPLPESTPLEETRIEVRLVAGHSIFLPSEGGKQALRMVLDALDNRE